MKVAKNFYARVASLRPLHLVLALSLLANVVFISKIYYPSAKEALLEAMDSPPEVVTSDHVRGNPAAKATIIAYMDFECPFCARLHAAMGALLKETDARLVYRHFPLASHTHAQRAAEAAECAGAQGKFWEYSNVLFSPENKIAEDGDFTFARIASNLGLDTKAFTGCLSSGQFRERVDAQRAEGLRHRINGTPTFYVNGKRFNGTIPIEQLRSALAAAE